MTRQPATRKRVSAAAILLGLWASAVAGAPAPKVVRAVPDNGATDVAPGLAEIRVTFDRDMDLGSASWVGGGETFPTIRGRPRWIDRRTAVLRCILQPNHTYQLSINSGKYRGFRGADGTPVEPQTIRFITADGKGLSETPAAELNAAALVELRTTIREDYSYRDLRKVDWAKVFERHGAGMIAARRA